jgi:hypothetical protein
MPAKFSILTICALPIIPIALACGGDDGDSGKITVQPDASMPDAAVICTALPSYAGVATGSNTQFATNYPASGTGSAAQPHVQSYLGAMNADIDALRLLLFGGFGGFGSGDIKPGTYQLTGDETAFSTCGACVLVGTDVTQSGQADWYMATSGSITLTMAGGGSNTTLSGSLTGVNFAHVGKDADGLPTDTVVDTCVTSIPSANFTATLRAPSMATGKREALLSKRYILTH